MYRPQQSNLQGGKGYSTELAGRDRHKFFKRPVEGEEDPATVSLGQAQIHYASSCPSTSPLLERGGGGGNNNNNNRPLNYTSHSRQLMMRGGSAGGGRGRPHHLPRLSTSAPRTRSRSPGKQSTTTNNNNKNKSKRSKEGSARDLAATYSGFDPALADSDMNPPLQPNQRTTAVQTQFRENEVQTDPYSPDYYIPEGAPEPEILQLQHLTFKDGLPPGKEEVELIQRLRRRKEIEASVPQGDDAASVEKRYRVLHELEEEEWKEREAHMEQLQERRLQQIKEGLLEREAAREEYNRERLEKRKEEQLATLRTKLDTLETKRMGTTRQALDRKLNSTFDPSKPLQTTALPHSAVPPTATGKKNKDLLQSYVQYGKEAAAPQMGPTAPLGGTQARGLETQYDIRPALLAELGGVAEVEAAQGRRIERVKDSAFTVPENAAIHQLPTLHKRHEAEKLVHALEYAHQSIQHQTDDTVQQQKEETLRVLERYRATPKIERPDTPELELDGDEDEEVEEACVLLQRLLRGRAVQNDFFEGKERCRGLIEELQAASNAQYAARTLADAREREEAAAQREVMLQTVLEEVQGEVIADTLGYLMMELTRQREVLRLRVARDHMEDVRRQREEEERQRRERVRQARDREEVQYAALVGTTRVTATAFLEDLYFTTVQETALEAAVAEERERQSLLPAPCQPSTELEAENLVGDLLDHFIIDAAVDRNLLREKEQAKKAPALAAFSVALECCAALVVDETPG